jgi:hypothetical protein
MKHKCCECIYHAYFKSIIINIFASNLSFLNFAVIMSSKDDQNIAFWFITLYFVFLKVPFQLFVLLKKSLPSIKTTICIPLY